MKELLKVVLFKKVIDNLNLDITYKSLYNAVSVDNPEATRIIRDYV